MTFEIVAWAPHHELRSWLAEGWRVCRGAHAGQHRGHAAYSTLVHREVRA
jgi:hypothetical protein